MDESEVENEQVLSISEFVEGMEAEQLQADLVLGGDEGKECTYVKGYLRRQAVFSCLSCTPAGNAGFCTACSLVCHDGHEVCTNCWTIPIVSRSHLSVAPCLCTCFALLTWFVRNETLVIRIS